MEESSVDMILSRDTLVWRGILLDVKIMTRLGANAF